MDTGRAGMELPPAVIHRLDLEPSVTVYSELQPGATYPEIYAEVERRLPELALPTGVRLVPGLLLSGYSFGFTAMLGVITLVGIVVNNAIVLIDTVDAHLNQGMAPAEAVIQAVMRRTRPILLTTVTTVAGLMPLTFASSTLWPPMPGPSFRGCWRPPS